MKKIKSDLIIETDLEERIKQKTFDEEIEVIKVLLDEKKAEKYKQKKGVYFTLFADFLNTPSITERMIETLNKILKQCLNYYKLSKKNLNRILIVGLGNRDIKSDALGPLVVDNINVNNHIEKKDRHKVAGFVPGVTGNTGIETFLLVESVCKSFKPDLIITIDSLFSKSILRINKTIQITTTGVKPGSGMGNHLKEISFETLNVPVLAIGIPTVVDFYSLIYEFSQNCKEKEISDTLDIFKDDKYNMVVSSKDIKDEMEIMCYIISQAINEFFYLN